MHNGSAPSITAIVPAWQAATCIGRCIDALRAAGFGEGDIVVIDDASTDGTAQTAAGRGVRVIVLSENAGAAVARNIGAAEAAADILFFADADCLVHADVRERTLSLFRDDIEPAAVFGCYDDRPEATSAVSRVRNLLHRQVHLECAGEVTTFWTGCGAVRRHAFEGVGGFLPNQPMMEDVALGLRLARAGHRIKLDPSLQCTHVKRWTLTGMAETDLLRRAVPWARLMRSDLGRGMSAGLNVSARGFVSVAATATCCLGLLVLPLAPRASLPLVALGLAMLVLANIRFLGTLSRTRPRWHALAAVPVLWVHYFCGGLGFAWVRSGLDALVRPTAPPAMTVPNSDWMCRDRRSD